MKKISYLLGLLAIGTALTFNACTKDTETETERESILPSSFRIDIPSSISSTELNRSTTDDVLNGNDIYGHLRNFIAVGEESGRIVESIIFAINVYHINQAMSINYTSDEDNRQKNLVVVENVTFEGKTYEFKLTVTDALSEGNADGGKALQVFWNRSPIEGISILKPYNINRTENTTQQNAIFRVDYSENSSFGYDKHMIVSIADLSNDNADNYYVDNLKMFVGKTGDIIEVYGNSNHPNANFFTNDTGFDWAFVASSDRTENIGVAEVGLPSNMLNSSDRAIILDTNSLRNIFNDQIIEMGYAQADVDNYLQNTEAPGYFNNGGFVQGGTAPTTDDYSVIKSRIDNLTPYNPTDIRNLSIAFD